MTADRRITYLIQQFAFANLCVGATNTMRSSLDPARKFLASQRRKWRKGSILVLAAILMVVMFGLLAMSIDSGYVYTMQTQLDRSVDAAALAGASALVEGTDAANEMVIEYLIRNPVGKPTTVVTDDQLIALTAQFLEDHADDYDIEWGTWDVEQGKFYQTNTLPSAISVEMTYRNLPFFFARALGKENFTLSSRAIAMYQPRDIMVVLDFSASMNDDSEFGAISQFGKDAIMAGLERMYEELDSPTYGLMQFEPQYITLEGVDPANASQPKIFVEYRGGQVYVESSKDLSNVVVRYTNGYTYKYDNLSCGQTGTFGNGNTIAEVWVKSGTNASGDGPGYGENFDFSDFRAAAKTALELTDVPYPYASGSWNSFIDYCRSNYTNRSAGFQYKLGYANLINYWLEQKPAANQTEDLWKLSAQPVTAVKDALDVFMEYVTAVDTNDRIGLAVYDAADGNGELESELTMDFDYVVDLARHRQAGHYHSYTNIAAGMSTAIEQLQQNGRSGAFKMIVLMTDGRANWYNGQYNTSAAYSAVLAEAQAAANLNIPVVAISLGAGADTTLMNSVADLTKSRHFNIPGGQSVTEYRDDLFDVFRAIADSRPLKLVQ